MKKSFAIAAALLSLLPSLNTANAGILIGAIAGNVQGGLVRGAEIGGGIALVFGVLYVEGLEQGSVPVIDLIGSGLLFGAVGALVGGVLDVDAALSVNAIEANLKTSYPFINSPEAITELAVHVKSKFHEQAQANPNAQTAFVQISREELVELLKGANMKQAHFEQLVLDLK